MSIEKPPPPVASAPVTSASAALSPEELLRRFHPAGESSSDRKRIFSSFIRDLNQ